MRILVAFVFICLTFAVQAQEKPRAILVLDGSGSMWGQIDGVAKITIAQQVVGTLLQDLPDTQELGLTVYGHRRKGDCSDIETLVAPGADTRGAISTAVNGISPRGKTPMTDAIKAAAEALKFTEEKATVILVSDGIETCAPDPCAAARALEEAGVDFTAHVVGFDVGDDAVALDQMRCIADETGGTFRSAANADELGEALSVVAEPAPPTPVTLTARAYIDPTGQQITEGLIWSLTGPEDNAIIENAATKDISQDVLPGRYQISVLRIEDEAFADGEVVIDPADASASLRLELPEILKPARLSFEARLDGSGRVVRRDLDWTIQDRDGNAVFQFTGPSEATELMPGRYTVSATRTEDGVEVTQEVALLKQGKRLILEFPPLAAAATIDGPAAAPVGSTILVDWTGPNEQNDYLSIAKQGDKDRSYETYQYTRKGPTLELTMPPEPGQYELRYFMAAEGRVAVSVPIEATPVTARLGAAAEASSGATIDVAWDGPDYQNDYIDVAMLDAKNNSYINYRYTRYGSPAQVQMPVEPGRYQLRYIMANGRVILATQEIMITEENFNLSGPAEAIAGDTVKIDWIGPDLKNDFISVAKKGDKASRYETYEYTRNGSPAEIQLPLEEGEYEIRYIVSQGKEMMASYDLKVLPVAASLSAADSAPAGSMLDVTWEGPGYQRDYVSIAEIGSKPTKYLHYSYTRNGKSVEVQVPSRPGQYELRYLAQSNKSKMLTSKPFTVTDVSASITAPASTTIGAPLDVSWQGPGYDRDYIAIFPEGEDRKYIHYQYTRGGDPLSIRAPDIPGRYELRYVMGEGRRVLANVPLVVE